MADIDIEELKKLSPEQRLRALKDLEEKSRKEIEEARKLMAESHREIEVKEEHERDMPIPQLTSVDIDSLFSQEEKEMFKAKRFVSERGMADEKEKGETRKEEAVLEEVLHREKMPDMGEKEAHQYGARLEMIRDRVYELQDMTQNNPGRFVKYEDEYKEELESMKSEFEDIHHKYKTAGDAVAQEATIGGQIDKLLGWYRR